MIVNFNIEGYIEEYLGGYFSGLKHLFIALLFPLIELWNAYSGWYVEMNYQTNISSQTISIAGNLNKLFDNYQKRIYITDGNFNPLIYFPLDVSEGDEIFFPLDISEGNEVYFPIDDYERVGDTDFIINIPVSLASKELEIIGIVKLQKLAGKIFTINYI